MLDQLTAAFASNSPVVQGLLGGIVIATFNMLGAMLILVWRNPTERFLDGSLGFAAGVMLSASFTSLLLPGIEAGGVVPVLVGFFLGVAVLDQGDRWVPQVQPLISRRFATNGGDDGDAMQSTRVRSVVLFTVAITLHNMPEGLAVGVGFGAGDVTNALALMFAIGIQNIPEGLAVSVAAINAGLGRKFYAAVAGIRAGLVEIPLAVFGAWAVTIAAPLLPYAMGFAAGGMLFVIAHEIVPQTQSRGYERTATLGLMVGAAIMLYLDVTLG
ncbi:MAG: ZIP family metal transporter [Halobacteriota archaeon]